MTESYDNILKVQIGRVEASAKSNNYFPLIGEVIKIDASTKWGQSSEWQIKSGVDDNVVITAGGLILQKDSKEIPISGAGELPQRFIASNNIFSVEVLKTIYAMSAQALPYFGLTLSREIVRAGGEVSRIRIAPENGYAGEHTVVMRVYKENETATPSFSFTNTLQGDGYKYVEFSTSTASDRGIYDLEVDCIDSATGQVLSKRINKLITVTPALCPKPADTTIGYEVADTYNSITSYSNGKWLTFEIRLWRDVEGSGLNYAEAILPYGSDIYAKYDFIPIHNLPSGTTLCLKLDPLEPGAYPFRMLVQGGSPSNLSSENGTPNFTHDTPLIITHDSDSLWEWQWTSYGSIQFANNCRNIVLDGRGYNNTGIHFSIFDETQFYDSCMYFGGGLSDIEVFGCDVDGAGFAGISAKSDPAPDQPWYWRESAWEFKNLLIHHCRFRNTHGEGIYLGYFGTGNLGDENNPCHAHVMRNPRVYRCEFSHNGFDSIQIANAIGVEVCYCDLIDSAYRQEVNQASAFALAMDGKIYNCRVLKNNGDIGFINPFMSGIEMYNNVLISGRGNAGIRLTYWSEQGNEYIYPDMDGIDHNLSFDFHHNILKASTIAVLNGDLSFSGFTMDDNVFITEKGNTGTPGYFTGAGNVFVHAGHDYATIDTALKVADAANDNYQPAHDSPVVGSGVTSGSGYDMRGYKNWFANVHHSGPLMGIYKSPDIIDENLVLDALVLSGGTASTLSQAVSVTLSYKGDATKYRIGESADLSGAEWIDIPAVGSLEYTLSEGFGAKTVYAQISSDTDESNILSSAIVYLATPLTLDCMTATVDSKLRVDVLFGFSGSYLPTKYRIGEIAGLPEDTWMDYSDSIQYTFASSGGKILYGQLEDAVGNISEIRSATVTVSDMGRRAVLSLGWANFIDNPVFEEELKVNKMLFVNHTDADGWKWQDGNAGGTIKNNTNISAGIKSYSAAKGATTGDDGGIYPDSIIEKAALVRVGYNPEWTYEEAELSLSNGSYSIRLYNSTIATLATTINFCKYQLVVNGVEYDYDFPEGYDVRNNLTQWLERTITVTDNVPVKLRWGVLPVNTFVFCPLNIIEIEEL